MLGDISDKLKLKVDGLAEMERECVSTLDKMAVTPRMVLHSGTGNIFGDVILCRRGNTCMCFYVGRDRPWVLGADALQTGCGTPTL